MKIRRYLWILYITGFIASVYFWLTSNHFFGKLIVDVYRILFPFAAVIISYLKSKRNHFCETFEGKTFCILLLIFLFGLYSETMWQIHEKIFGYNVLDMIYNIWINIGWVLQTILTLILTLWILVYYNKRLTIQKQIIWIIVTIVIVFLYNRIAFDPILHKTTFFYTFFKRLIIQLIYNIFGLLNLVLSIGAILSIGDVKKARLWFFLAWGMASVSVSLLALNFVVDNYSYEEGYLVHLGFVFYYLVTSSALSKYNFKYELDKEFAHINLERNLINILSFIRNNRNCIKMDITRRFNITRKTTDARLNQLRELGLIEISKSGRSSVLIITERGLDYLNFLNI